MRERKLKSEGREGRQLQTCRKRIIRLLKYKDGFTSLSSPPSSSHPDDASWPNQHLQIYTNVYVFQKGIALHLNPLV